MRSQSHLITEEELMAWTGYTRPSDLERWMKKNNIRLMAGKDGRLGTTIEAVNDALRQSQTSDFNNIEFAADGPTKSH